LGYASDDGWTHPYLEYRAAEESRWVQPTHFEAKKGNGGAYLFMAILPGVVAPESHPDIHVTDSVVRKWKTQCKIDAVVVLM
jgi:hypothetical protein